MSRPREWPRWSCPICRGSLTEGPDGFECTHKHHFEVVVGVPRFVGAGSYADSFGAQWLEFRKTQLDSYTGLPISRDRLLGLLGDLIWTQLPSMQVLECGAGAGRFTEVLLNQGATVTAIDLSPAIEANNENLGDNPRHRAAQADINALPLPAQSFDLVVCPGVVQHTPAPEETIQSLYQQVKPGGYLAFDHYRSSPMWAFRLAPLFRFYYRRLPADEGMVATRKLTQRLLAIHRRAAENRGLEFLLTRVSPVITYYSSIPELSEELQFEWAALDTHDALTDRFKRRRSGRSISRTLESLGATEIVVNETKYMVEARCRRPKESN